MKRRRFLQVCIVGALTLPGGNAALASSHEAWRSVCEAWLKMFIPEDSIGPGANHPIIWERLTEVMNVDAGTARRYQYYFMQLQDIGIPVTDEQLNVLMAPDSPVSSFLYEFHRVVIEAYYGSELGWKDLGLLSAPQPSGFALRG